MNDLWVSEISFHEKNLGNSCPNCFHSRCQWLLQQGTMWMKNIQEETNMGGTEFLHKKRDGYIFSFRRAVEFPVPCSSLHACNTKAYKNSIFLPSQLIARL